MKKIDDVDLTGSEIESYHLGPKLGGGGFADVYLANQLNIVDRSTIRHVAIKVFLAEQDKRQDLLQIQKDFSTEMKNLGQLTNEAPIITVFHNFVEDIAALPDGGYVTFSKLLDQDKARVTRYYTGFFIVMEYADGGSLDGNYQDQMMTLENATEFLSHFKDVCVALGAAHAHSIIHRDVKPGNIFWFRQSNSVKLGDFGIAKTLPDLGLTFELTGSLNYLAPEVFQYRHYSEKSDIYALGCTFYELLTSQRAFDLRTTELTLDPDSPTADKFEVIHKTAPRPDAIRQCKLGNLFSVKINAMLKKMMDVDPALRPSLAEVIEGLTAEQARHVPDIPNIIVGAAGSYIPITPIYRSTPLINPNFRKRVLNEFVYFVLLDIHPQSPDVIGTVFRVLDTHLGKHTYSFWEILGSHAFLVKVWMPNAQMLEKAIQILNKYVVKSLDGNEIQVFRGEDASYVGINTPSDFSTLDKTLALINLNDAFANDDAVTSMEWLREHSVVCADKKSSTKRKSGIRCFCVVRSLSQVNDEDERQLQTTILRDAISQTGLDAAKLEVELYRKAYRGLENVRTIPADHIITYLAPSFDKVVEIPGTILQQATRSNLFKTTTLLSSGRFVIEREGVFMLA